MKEHLYGYVAAIRHFLAVKQLESLPDRLRSLFFRFLCAACIWITTSAASLSPAACFSTGDPLPVLAPLSKAEAFGPQILAYLTALGSSNGLQEAFSLLRNPADPRVIYQAVVVNRDVTGDRADDIVVNVTLPGSESRALFVFSCRSGKYVSLYQNINAPALIAVKDMNLDGKAEIVVSNPDCTVGCMVYYDILGWNGQQFISLARNNDPPCYGPCLVNGTAEISAQSENGALALVLVAGWDSQYGPGCNLRQTWTLDGQAFVKGRRSFCLPRYRIHAVYAGDDASQSGDYRQALHFYQQVIFESGLLSGRDWQQRLAAGLKAAPVPDLTEWARLSAYARYRIFLLQTLWQDEPSARLVYTALEERFPAGSPGHPYAILASVFREAYRQTGNIASACSQAAQYATANTGEILTPLSQAVYGKNNRDYQPGDICPFK